MHHYLTYQYVPAPWSIYEGVSKLSPGHILTWQDGKVEARQVLATGLRGTRNEQFSIGSRSRRTAAGTAARGDQDPDVQRAAAGRVPVGRRRLLRSGRGDGAKHPPEPVKTFSIGFEDGRSTNGTTLGGRRHYGTDHHELVVTSSALEVLPSLAWHFDEPFADSSAIPTVSTSPR